MSASLVIVREVAGHETAQVPFAKDEYMIQTLAPDGADEPLREGVLPRAVRGDAGDVAMRAGLRPTAKAVDLPPDSNAGAPAFYPTGVPRQSSTRPLRT